MYESVACVMAGKGRSYNLERVRTADGTNADNGANEQAKPPADSAETKIPVGSSKQPTGDVSYSQHPISATVLSFRSFVRKFKIQKNTEYIFYLPFSSC